MREDEKSTPRPPYYRQVHPQPYPSTHALKCRSGLAQILKANGKIDDVVFRARAFPIVGTGPGGEVQSLDRKSDAEEIQDTDTDTGYRIQ